MTSPSARRRATSPVGSPDFRGIGHHCPMMPMGHSRHPTDRDPMTPIGHSRHPTDRDPMMPIGHPRHPRRSHSVSTCADRGPSARTPFGDRDTPRQVEAAVHHRHYQGCWTSRHPRESGGLVSHGSFGPIVSISGFKEPRLKRLDLGGSRLGARAVRWEPRYLAKPRLRDVALVPQRRRACRMSRSPCDGAPRYPDFALPQSTGPHPHKRGATLTQ